MKSISSHLIFAAAVLSLSSCTTTSGSYRQQNLSITTRSGVKTLVAKNWHINDDCSQIDYPEITIIEQSRHGRLEIIREPLFPKLVGKQSKCAEVKVNGVVAYYTPHPGYVGSDRLIIHSPYEAGKTEESVENTPVATKLA